MSLKQQKNKILNGLADWVYEEEFGHAKQYEWDASGNAIVFVKSNETEVPEMYIPIYEKQLYPSEMRFKYPKAGEKNSEVSAFLYQLNSAKLSKIDLGQFKNYYIPNVIKTAKADEIILITSQRTQNASDVLKINTKTGIAKKLFTETDEKWIDTDNVTMEFLDDNSFIWGSERDGNLHFLQDDVEKHHLLLYYDKNFLFLLLYSMQLVLYRSMNRNSLQKY
jgi:dipeptidyl-peptidase-4